MLYTGKIVTFLGVYFTRLCFKLNNSTGQKFGMSELKLSWPVTLTGNPPAVISRPATHVKQKCRHMLPRDLCVNIFN